KLPRDDIAVTAIIARAAEDQSRERPGITPDRLGRSHAGALHQHLDRGARRDRLLFGGAHLVSGQDRPVAAHRTLIRAGSRNWSPPISTRILWSGASETCAG